MPDAAVYNFILTTSLTFRPCPVRRLRTRAFVSLEGFRMYTHYGSEMVSWTFLRVTSKSWLVYCDSRFGLPLSLTSSMLRARLAAIPFAASLHTARAASLGPTLETTFARYPHVIEQALRLCVARGPSGIKGYIAGLHM